jgi:hypothetical protein
MKILSLQDDSYFSARKTAEVGRHALLTYSPELGGVNTNAGK